MKTLNARQVVLHELARALRHVRLLIPGQEHRDHERDAAARPAASRVAQLGRQPRGVRGRSPGQVAHSDRDVLHVALAAPGGRRDASMYSRARRAARAAARAAPRRAGGRAPAGRPRSASTSAEQRDEVGNAAARAPRRTLQPFGGTRRRRPRGLLGALPAPRARAARPPRRSRGRAQPSSNPTTSEPSVEHRRRRLEARQRARQHDRALVAVHPHHQLEPDLLQRDVAAAARTAGRAAAPPRAVHRELLREPVVQHGGRVGAGEDRRRRARRAAPRRSPPREVRRPQHRHRRESRLDVRELLLLDGVPRAEVARPTARPGTRG